MAFEALTWLFGSDDDGDSQLDLEGVAMSDAEDASSEAAPDLTAADAGTGVDDLAARLDELETELDQNETSIRAVQSTQEELAESVDDMHDTVRRLLGVYDQLTAQANPFRDDDGGRFGVVAGAGPDAEAAEADGGANGADGAADGEGTVSFADLKDSSRTRDDDVDGTGGARSNGEAPPADAAVTDAAANGERIETADVGGAVEEAGAEHAGDGAHGDDLHRGAVVPAGVATEGPQTESPSDAGVDAGRQVARETASDAVGDPAGTGGGATAALDELPQGLATEAFVFEWLAELVERAGPAGALKAIAYYESVDWIAPDVKRHLEDVLSGPALDIHVDPAQPSELTAMDHAESYEYVMRLRELGEMELD